MERDYLSLYTQDDESESAVSTGAQQTDGTKESWATRASRLSPKAHRAARAAAIRKKRRKAGTAPASQ